MIYILLLICLIITAFLFDFCNYKIGNKIIYNIYLIVFITIAGFRYKVGGDTIGYMTYFETIPTLTNLTFEYIFSTNRGFLWIVLNSISKSILDDFVLFQIIHALIINLIIFWFIKKYCKYRFTALLLYYFFIYLYFNTEILRESLAVCFFLLGYPFLEKKKYIYFLLFSIVSLMFHSSAIILILILALSFLKLNKIGILILLSILISVFFFQDYIALIFVDDFTSSKYQVYSSINANINGIIVNSVVFIIVPTIFLRFYLKKFRSEIKFDNLYVSYFFIAFIVVVIPGFNRFLNYFTPFLILIFVDILFFIWRSKKYSQIRFGLVLFCFVLISIPKAYYYLEDTSDIYQGTRRYNRWHPYTNVIEKEEYSTREYLYYNSINLQ